jgi:predicted transcriptional regulator
MSAARNPIEVVARRALEIIKNNPGITLTELNQELGIGFFRSERALYILRFHSLAHVKRSKDPDGRRRTRYFPGPPILKPQPPKRFEGML